MIKLYEEKGLTYADLVELHEWENNPRIVKEDDYLNLKKQMDLGEFKPLLVMEDGTVLGGNTRIKVYREKGFTRVWISLIKFIQDEETSQYRSYVNGKESKRTFKQIEQGMLEYALVDNVQAGQYDSQKLTELAMPYQYDIPMEVYKIPLAYPVKLQSLLDSVQPSKIIESLDPSEHWKGMPEFKQEDKGAFRQIIVSFESEEDVIAFAELVGQQITEKTKSIWYPPHERESRDVEYAQESPAENDKIIQGEEIIQESES